MTIEGRQPADDLVIALQERLSLQQRTEAEELLEAVLQGLAYILPAELIGPLCDCVPSEFAWCLRCGPGTPDPLIDSELFLGWVMSTMQTTGGSDRTLGGEDPLASLAADEARYRAQAALDELFARVDGELAAACGACLPAGLIDAVDPRSRR